MTANVLTTAQRLSWFEQIRILDEWPQPYKLVNVRAPLDLSRGTDRGKRFLRRARSRAADTLVTLYACGLSKAWHP
jgi:hypothetical protein